MQDNSPESMSSALTSCRRLLMTIADSIFPPQKEKWIDQKGKERKVGVEEYKNRLLAYIGSDIDGKSSFAIITSEVEHLASKLDAIYEKSCKGVHNDISAKEARLAVVHTYLFIAELARVSHIKIKEKSMKKIQNPPSQGKQFQESCHYCGSTVGEISQRTEELTNAMYDCEKCNVNYCDQCSYEKDVDGQVKHFCLRCENELEKIE